MRLLFLATGTILALAAATLPRANAQGVQQMLKGLTTGNPGQDQALNDAFERGYQKGRQDEAQNQRSNRSGGSNRGVQQNQSGDSRYNDNSGLDRSQSPNGYQGNNSYSR